ncbi:bacillithiol biosynthesis cysteine-adding enzyme BshC [bacterium]|nr:bacillithiol biosynthesis cysteine-adding enzyme BshC [bacterium]
MITLPFSSLPGTPDLFVDYTENVSDASNYFMGHFQDLLAYETHLGALERRGCKREELYEILVRQNKQFRATDATFANLEAFRQEQTFTVVTGQQVGLFTGPLYSIYKALTAVQMARWLTDQFPGYRFVPVFWLETEDHDFLEINNCGQINEENNFTHITYAQPEEDAPRNLTPIHLMNFDERIEESFAQLEQALPETDFTPDVLRMLRQAYAEGEGLAKAFARFFNALYPDSGMIFLDPSDHEVKQLAAPVILQELETYPTTGEEVIKRSAELEERYHAQIKPRAVNLFFIHKNNRYSIEPSEYGFFLKGTRQRFTQEELLEIANNEPERFSPNVLLRPIMQDFLLPTVAYIAGPSEVSYFAQLQPAYDHFGLPMPLIIPRASLTIVERKVDKVFKKFDLPYSSMFLDNEEAYRLISMRNGQKARFNFEDFRSRVEELLGEMEFAASEEDANLGGPANSTSGQVRKALSTFEDKLFQHRKQRDDVLMRQIDKMHVYLAPEGKPQERQLNIITLLNRYGRDVLPMIEEACQPFPAEHRLLFL